MPKILVHMLTLYLMVMDLEYASLDMIEYFAGDMVLEGAFMVNSFRTYAFELHAAPVRRF